MDQETRTCAGCRHFCQHFVHIRGNQYKPTAYGHCVSPRLRDKKPDTPACQRFYQR